MEGESVMIHPQSGGHNRGEAMAALRKSAANTLGKDAFIKLLITQLSHQDPTKPMEDKEFIAQMAQFSSLEQMTNMSQSFASLAAKIGAAQAVSLLGQSVEIQVGDKLVQGVVSAVTAGHSPQILVNGTYYDHGSVKRIVAQEEQ